MLQKIKKIVIEKIKLLWAMLMFEWKRQKRAGGICQTLVLVWQKEEKSTKLSKITFALHSSCYLFYFINPGIPCFVERVLYVSLG